MTVQELSAKTGFPLLCGNGLRPVQGIYCCDLLSLVMGRAPADCAWVTVMGNLNSIAVAVLADISCIVLAENMPLDADALARAQLENVAVLQASLPVYPAVVRLQEAGAASE